jgi:3-phenylpropionate/trans-cinnamate dioxygenase ferredoxin reductase component
MTDYRYLIVGGGMTGDAACRGIREHDADGSIGLVGAEDVAPYARPPLSKALWQGKSEDSIWRGTAELGVELHLGRRIVELDLDRRAATDDAGERYGFERVLLATGGRPRRLPVDDGEVVYFRTIADYHRLRAAATEGTRAAVIGGGFIGSELAAALAGQGCRVTLVFPEEGIGGRLFSPDLAAFVTDYYREQGVEVLPGELVGGVARSDDGIAVELGGSTLSADVVVAGLGLVPAVELAETTGLEVDDGIVVDEFGRAGDSGVVFAAGDVARFPALVLGTMARVEHENHANTHGHTVGANMAGAETRYENLPFFYSDLFDLGYEAVGEVDSRHRTLAEWAEPYRRGVVAYVDADDRPRGFLLWDVWGQIDAGVALIAAKQPVGPEILRSFLE